MPSHLKGQYILYRCVATITASCHDRERLLNVLYLSAVQEELEQVQQTLSEQDSANLELQAEIKYQKTRLRELEREVASVSALRDSAGQSHASVLAPGNV